MKHKSLAAILGIMAIGLLFAAAQWRRANTPPAQAPDNPAVEPPSSSAPPRADGVRQHSVELATQMEKALERIDNFPIKMSEWDFDHLRVSLPNPVDKPWEGPFYNSRTCFAPDAKLAAVDVLPVWIRKAMLAGEPELAARYLWSFLKFTDDANREVQTKAVFSLYGMGDSQGTALSKMKQWIENGASDDYLDTEFGSSRFEDIRQRVLEKLDYYGDTSLLPTVYEMWTKNEANEGKDLARVDYGYYLEKHGRTLPVEYWLNRLQNPYAVEDTLRVLETRKPAALVEQLQSALGPLPPDSKSNSRHDRTMSIAAALFRLTGDARYRDYLIDQAQRQLASSGFPSSVRQTLNALAATNDKASLDILSGVRNAKGSVLREDAIAALGHSQLPEATDMLFESAQIEAKTRFPKNQLRALLAQNNPGADAKYQEVRRALLSGDFGWHAQTSDFAPLEAFRKYGRRD